MPSWDELGKEIRSVAAAHDQVRRKYLRELSELTGRSVIVYYSGWNEKSFLAAQGIGPMFTVSDADKNGFMATIHGLDRTKGLDLILHTPGGDIAATESLVDYLRSMFGTDLRAIVPHLAMSAGTMIALSAKQIVMGKHSSLGPIDPQIGGRAAHGVIEEFKTAKDEIAANPVNIAVWQPIIAKYTPTLVGECEKAIKWADQMTRSWLTTGMFADDDDPAAKAAKVVSELSSHSVTLTHNRHYSADAARNLGLDVLMLEDEPALQEAVLTVHHACVLTLSETGAVKIIENDQGSAHITAVQVGAQMQMPVQMPMQIQMPGQQVPQPLVPPTEPPGPNPERPDQGPTNEPGDA
jgi:hypothetical protein